MHNPYTSRNMIQDRTLFFGRQREIEEIFTNLLQGFQSTSIVGERRIGKSSLLWYLMQPEVYQPYLQNGDRPFLFVLLDLQRVAGLDQQAFFKFLSKSLAEQLPEKAIYALDPADFDSWQEYFSEFVQEMSADFRIVICVDEFESIASSADFNRDFLQNLRAYANQGQVAYITASKSRLDEICQTTEHIMGSDFWNIFVSPPVYLGLLTQDEGLSLINHSAKFGIPFHEDEIALLIELAGYHPLFLNTACFHLFDLKKIKYADGEKNVISIVERHQITNNFLMAATPHFEQIWKHLNPTEKHIIGCDEVVDLNGKYKHTINYLVKRGILLDEYPLKPFCLSFQTFARELYNAEQQTTPGTITSSNNTVAIPFSNKNLPSSNKLDIWIGEENQLLLNLSGMCNIALFGCKKTEFNPNTIKRFNRLVHELPNDQDWRFKKQEIGRAIELLFEPVPELRELYTQGRAASLNDEEFLITFKCSKEMIAFPFELINTLSTLDDGLRHLALCHPIRKTILGIRSKRRPPSSDFYRDPLFKILIVSSNVSGIVEIKGKNYQFPDIPGTGKEIWQLEEIMADLQKNGKMLCTVDVEYDITYSDMISRLQSGNYDMIHYSGHGVFAESPEDSCLLFWEKPGGKQPNNRAAILTATELNAIVERSNIRFAYLSCCQSGTTGTIDQFFYSDFLGITHALVVGGVPSVLAMRWPLNDNTAVLLASTFYKELFSDKDFASALFSARKYVQSKYPNDYNWLSPMLIVQGD